MKKENITTKVEVYICNFERETGESCGALGAKGLTDDLKKWAKEEHKGDIKVVRSGCLGACEKGIAIACYPEKSLLHHVTKNDGEEIKKGLREALEKLRG